MNQSKIDELINKIKSLENELESEVEKEVCLLKSRLSSGEKIIGHEKEALLHYLLSSPIRHYVSIPFIWMLILPAVVLDIAVTLYQFVCFPLYRIAKVKRRDYIVIDRQHLSYLNIIQKFNCMYCGYFNGLISYISEIAGRTEQYWCPIKHAKRVKGRHKYYHQFFAYGDSKSYTEKYEEVRKNITE